MANTIEQNADTILHTMIDQPREKVEFPNLSGNELRELTNLSPEEINDAVTILVQAGLAQWLQALGTTPYDFMAVGITPRGRYEYERARERVIQKENPAEQIRLRPPSPIGSPYGFNDEDWEAVSEKKSDSNRLFIVFGHQFISAHYDSDLLTKNVQDMFQKAITEYRKDPVALQVSLEFQSLGAGYGEHLFNEIARDIIGADIAVFETSDLNPNVMVEMGVALTWGVRVLPIKVEGQPRPPSDISGQTWADYKDNGSEFIDPDHEKKLIRMIDRAVRKKSRA